MGRRDLSTPYAPLKIGLSEGAYSHNLCQPHAALAALLAVSTCSHRTCLPQNYLRMSCAALLRRAYPIDKVAKPVRAARGAGSPFGSQHMLAQDVLAAKLPLYAVRGASCGRHTRMMGRRDLSELHAPLKIGLLESACSHNLCQPLAALYPIVGAVQPTKIARAAAIHFVRKYKPAHSLPAAQTIFSHFPIALVKGYGVKPHDEDGP